eukprot:CAMPEP_0197491022 /NCGR_PEP_ID=MMETSP1311-20131121/5415_1 /TAXON_ID=464262 /ORGANISM="Genus nov. species nov., Strain RCC856" /LENGTH=89 /DNA_ID=CAMNT_0043035627 /DNA_START=83 /DNA_END=352 /DNA_ORIENTATION=+
MPRWSLFGPQYRGFNLGVLGSVWLLMAYAQKRFHPDFFIIPGFVIVLIGLFFHEIRPVRRRGYGDILDEFRESAADEDAAAAAVQKKQE